MDSAEIIEEIRHLPPDERARVALFLRQLDEGRQWTGPELSEAAATMTSESDPTRVSSAWEQIAAGFYGKESDA